MTFLELTLPNLLAVGAYCVFSAVLTAVIIIAALIIKSWDVRVMSPGEVNAREAAYKAARLAAQEATNPKAKWGIDK